MSLGEKEEDLKIEDSFKQPKLSEKDKNTLLKSAYKNSNEYVILSYKKKGISVELTKEEKNYAFRQAVLKNKIEIVKDLIEKGVAVNQKDQFGGTGLIMAACSGYEEVVKLLVEAGADTEIKDQTGYKAVDYAFLKNFNKIVSFFQGINSKTTLAKSLNAKIIDAYLGFPFFQAKQGTEVNQAPIFIGYGESEYKDSAKEIARLNAASNLAIYLNNNIIIHKHNISTHAKRTDISGLKMMRFAWRLIGNPSGKYYEYAVLMAYGDTEFHNRPKEIIEQELLLIKINRRNKEFYQWLNNRLKKIRDVKELIQNKLPLTNTKKIFSIAYYYPLWVSNKWAFQTSKQEKYYLFTGKGDSEYKGTARANAEIDGFRNAYLFIKNHLIHKLKSIIKKAPPKYKKQIKKLIKRIEKNSKLKMSGFFPVGEWYRQIESSEKKPFYEFYLRLQLKESQYQLIQELLIKKNFKDL